MQTDCKEQKTSIPHRTPHELYRVLPAGVRPKLLDLYCCGGGAGYGRYIISPVQRPEQRL